MTNPLPNFLAATALIFLSACGSTANDDVAQPEPNVVEQADTIVGASDTEDSSTESDSEAETNAGDEDGDGPVESDSPAVDESDASTGQETMPDPIFSPILDDLLAGTSVEPRLPTAMSPDGEELFAELAVEDNGYAIAVGLTPDCYGAGACGFGSLSGQTMIEGYEGFEGGTFVKLPHGIEGRFYDSTCGASCSDGVILWMEGSVQYRIGQKAARGPEVIEMAWSAIDPTATFPAPPNDCGNAPEVASNVQAIVAQSGDYHWLVVCDQFGNHAELVDRDATVRMLGDTPFLGLDRADGTTAIFSGANPQLDSSVNARFSHPRLVINTDDIQCGQVDGVSLIADSSRGLAIDEFGLVADPDAGDLVDC